MPAFRPAPSMPPHRVVARARRRTVPARRRRSDSVLRRRAPALPRLHLLYPRQADQRLDLRGRYENHGASYVRTLRIPAGTPSVGASFRARSTSRSTRASAPTGGTCSPLWPRPRPLRGAGHRSRRSDSDRRRWYRFAGESPPGLRQRQSGSAVDPRLAPAARRAPAFARCGCPPGYSGSSARGRSDTSRPSGRGWSSCPRRR